MSAITPQTALPARSVTPSGAVTCNSSRLRLYAVIDASQELLEVEFDGFVDRAHLLAIPGVRNAEHQDGFRWTIASDAEVDVRPTLFQFAVDRQRKVLTLQKSARALEDVFKELTGNG